MIPVELANLLCMHFLFVRNNSDSNGWPFGPARFVFGRLMFCLRGLSQKCRFCVQNIESNFLESQSVKSTFLWHEV